jgi:hypothetical protein
MHVFCGTPVGEEGFGQSVICPKCEIIDASPLHDILDVFQSDMDSDVIMNTPSGTLMIYYKLTCPVIRAKRAHVDDTCQDAKRQKKVSIVWAFFTRGKLLDTVRTKDKEGNDVIVKSKHHYTCNLCLSHKFPRSKVYSVWNVNPSTSGINPRILF